MVAGQGDNKAFLQHFAGLDARDGGRQTHQSEIKLAVFQCYGLIRARHVLEFQFDAREAGMQRADQPWQQLGQYRGHKTKAYPADFAAPARPGYIRGMGRLVERGPGFGQEESTHFGQCHRVPVTLEQTHPQLFFKHFDLHAQGRLHDGQPLRGAAEVQLFGQGHK